MRRWWPIAALSGLIAIVATWSIWQSGTTGGLAGVETDFGDAETEEWFASYLNGSKIGHARRSVRWMTENGRRLRQTDEFHLLSAMKATDRVESTITSSEITTPQGHLVRFRHEIRQSQQPLVVTGSVQGNVLDIEQTTLGVSSSKRLRRSESIEGARAGTKSERAAHHARRITPFRGVHRGRDRHRAAFPTCLGPRGDFAAWRAAKTAPSRVDRKLPRGLSFRSTIWVDDQGRWQKQRNEDLGLETYRVTREQALAPSNAGDLNLLFDTLIKIERPIRNPSAAKSIRYRVHLENGDPAELFATSPSQSVKSLDSRTAEITVRSSDSVKLPGRPTLPPTRIENRAS